MITLITGAPGAGKTSCLVSLIRELAQKRAIFVDGIPDLVIPHEVLAAADWPTTVTDGSAVVVDEAQRIWRPRGSTARVPPSIELLETHRHRGLDFFILTQHPNLIDANIRRLVGRHIHLRDVGVLGRWWYEWPEATNPETFRTAPVKKRHSLDKKTFSEYKSASIHVKPIRSVPRALVIFVLAFAALIASAWYAYQRITSKFEPAPLPSSASASAPGRAASGPLTRSRMLEEVAPELDVRPATVADAAWRTVEAAPAYYPDMLAGCYSTANSCDCWSNGSPVRRLQVDPRLCLALVAGRYVAGPGRPPVVRWMPDPMAGGQGGSQGALAPTSAEPSPS